jgi:nucleoside-diphosphate-sugar epimerase
VPTVVVTGASGFVGRAAVGALVAGGHEVGGIARSAVPDVPVAFWREADLLAARPELPRASHLLHLAWTTEHGRFWDDPANAKWEQATIELVEAFARAGGRRVVFVGSCAQYDWSSLGANGLANESRTRRHAATPYGRAKQAAAEAASAVDVSFATALVFFPYGPFDQPSRLVPSLVRSLAAGQEARVSAGMQRRDFIHVTDVGRALAALLDSDVQGDVNIGTGHGASVREVATTVARRSRCEASPRGGRLPGVLLVERRPA